MKVFYIGRSANSKTGDIPQQFIGGTREESMQTCVGCKLLESKVCYAQYYTEGWAHTGIIKRQDYKDYSLEHALATKRPTAKYFRFGAIGDPSAINMTAYLYAEGLIKKAGLRILNYTHFWKTRGSHLIGKAMASCDTFQDALRAVRQGWRATVIVSKNFIDKNGTKGVYMGRRWALCPYQSHGTQCNDCGLCDASRKDLLPIIAFLEH